MSTRPKSAVSSGRVRRPDAEELIAAYERDCRLQGRTKSTISSRGYALRNFSRFLEGKGVHILDVGREVVRDWVEEIRINRSRSTATAKNNLTSVSGFYEYLVFESLVSTNPVPSVRKRYLKSYKEGNETHTHKIISVEEMAMLIKSAVDIRDRTLMLLMAKTGVRRGELIAMDANDINFTGQSILLKPTPKRSNRLVYFDNETEMLLRRWLKVRQGRNKWDDQALFISQRNSRLGKSGIDKIIGAHAQRLGFHDPLSDIMEDHFTSHCFRHWFVTHLLRAGMPRDHVKELRGDAKGEAIDYYNHIDKKELRESYLAHIPQLGI
jgi:integrase/recombinase XerD